MKCNYMPKRNCSAYQSAPPIRVHLQSVKITVFSAFNNYLS